MASGTLYIENLFNDDLFADPATPAGRRAMRGRNGLLLWLARPGDVFVLSREPDKAFWQNIAGLLGIDPDRVTILVPPPGRLGTDLLTRDRLADPAFLADLARTVRAVPECAAFSAYYQDRFTVTVVAEAAGLADSIPGRAFIAEGGADLLNCKSFFRAIAAGNGLPIASGSAYRDLDGATAAIWELVRAGRSAILKRDFHAGGFGNFLFSMNPDVRPAGVRELAVVTDRAQVHDFLTAGWPFLSGDGRFPVIVEHYHENCVTLCAEIAIGETGVRTDCLFEMRMTPRISGFRWLKPGDDSSPAAEFHRLAERLAELVRVLGYRGLINIDGIRTPAGRTLITEFNGRFSGITYLHAMLRRIVGPRYAHHRHVAAGTLHAESIEDAMAKLAAAGAEFDPVAREGVVLTADGSEEPDSFAYCAIGRSAQALAALEAIIDSGGAAAPRPRRKQQPLRERPPR